MTNCEDCGNELENCTCEGKRPKVTVTAETYEAIKQKVLDSTSEVKDAEKNELDAIKFRMNREWNTDMFSTCESINEVREVFKELVQDAQAKREGSNAPSGTAPIQNQYSENREGYGKGEKFDDYATMISKMRQREAEGDTEAKKILDTLVAKAHNELIEKRSSGFTLEGSLKEYFRNPSKAKWKKVENEPKEKTVRRDE